jgi:hypothetical protein
MTRDELLAHTRKYLANLARENGVSGWHDMKKDQLVDALVRIDAGSLKKRVRSYPVQVSAERNTSGNPEMDVEAGKFDVGTPRHIDPREPKDLPQSYGRDQIVALVRDPYWLYCYWELTPQALARAEATLSHDWYGAKPILRLVDVTSNDVSGYSERILRDIEIHGNCNHWYIDVNSPPRSYRIDIGYLTRSGRFCGLARSNVVTTPRAGMSDNIDTEWSDLDSRKAERLYAMSTGYNDTVSSLEIKRFLDERLQRPIGSSAISSFGPGSLLPLGKTRKFWFTLDAELVVYGATEPNAKVTIAGQPVSLRNDGTFTMRFKLPDARQMLNAIAISPDGSEERLIVLGIERNTKVMDPQIRDEED